MSFKFDSDPHHVQGFRAFVAQVKTLDEKIDTNALTPDEAWAEVEKLVKDMKFPEPAPHVKKAQAEAKKVADEEAKAAKEAADTDKPKPSISHPETPKSKYDADAEKPTWDKTSQKASR